MLPASEQIIRYVERHPGKRTRDLCAHFKVEDAEEEELVAHLMRLQLDGSLIRVPRAGWDVPERTEYRVGLLEIARAGQGFARVAAGTIKEEDVFVRPSSLGGAFPGDAVLLRVEGKEPRKDKAARGGRGKPGDRGRNGGARLREGTVVDVVERSRKLIRGKFLGAKDGGFVQPSDERLKTRIYVPHEDTFEAEDGEGVLVRVLDGAPRGGHPHGKVVVRLAAEGSYETDLRVICEVFELPRAHPREVLAEAERQERPRDGASWPGRVDLRADDVFTIDPEDARDFDDAISVERLRGGSVRVGVHIADVSHYVRPASELDREAERRGTSVYLPGHVVPMLPERLSNDLSSLRPGEDRLTKTVRMTYDRSGALTKAEVFRSVIRSKRRFTYEEALAILERIGGKEPSRDLPEGHAAYEEPLRLLAGVRDRLHAARAARGALYLDLPKARLQLDEDGEVVSLGRDERDPSHALIEELMLAANEAVAAYFVEKGLPLVARVHPPPEDKKLEDLKRFVDALGIRWKGKGGPHDFQALVKSLEGNPLSPLVQLGLLRTMGHAEYVLGPGLHFALATSRYCHFTSPIRRYPDLLVHQLLDEHFDGRLAKASHRRTWDERLPQSAEVASKLERRAEEAEREMTTLRLIRYLKPLIGREMAGMVVSVHPFGFFVRDEETLVEGLVHVATLDDDYYEFDREKMALKGRRRGRRFAVGERVLVELSDVDPDRREISFRFKKRLGGAK